MDILERTKQVAGEKWQLEPRSRSPRDNVPEPTDERNRQERQKLPRCVHAQRHLALRLISTTFLSSCSKAERYSRDDGRRRPNFEELRSERRGRLQQRNRGEPPSRPSPARAASAVAGGCSPVAEECPLLTREPAYCMRFKFST